MEYIVVFLLVILFLVSYKHRKVNGSIASVFIGYWAITAIIYCINYGINSSFGYIGIGCLSFFIGYFLFSKKIVNKTVSIQWCLSSTRETFLLYAYIVEFLSVCFLGFFSWQWYRMGYSWDTIRTLFLSGENFPILLRLFEVAYVIPLTFIAGIVFSVEAFYSKSKIKRPLIMLLSAASVLVFGLASQGRFIFLYFFVILLIAYLDVKKYLITQIDLRKYLVNVLFIIFLITFYRQIQVYNNVVDAIIFTFRSFLAYATIPFDLINYYIPIIDNSNLHGECSVFVGGIIDFLNSISSLIGFEIFSELTALENFVDSFSDAVNIRNSVTNSFVSLFTYFYLDFRIFGIFIYSFIFGLLCSIVSNKRYVNIKAYAIYLFFWILICMSPVRWGLNMQSMVISLLYVFIFFPGFDNRFK